MTRLPADAFKIKPMRGDEWPTYKVGPLCALSGCSKLADHSHHIVRRSFTAGPYAWVSIDGHVVGNLLPLCWQHHHEITENRARIVWDEEYGGFWWEDDGVGGFDSPRRLTQPPTLEAVKEREQVEQESPSCPTCGQKIRPKFEHRHEQRRPRKSWTITVPADEREFGADILDQLLESARLILDEQGLSYGEGRNVRYYILSTTLGYFVVHNGEL